MHINSVFDEKLLHVIVVSVFIFLVLSPVLHVNYKSMESVLVKALTEEDADVIDTNFKSTSESLEKSGGFQPNPIFTTFNSRLIGLRSRGFDTIDVSPVFTTFRCIWVRFTSKSLLTIFITVEPVDYVWNSRIIGAGRWYVFRVRAYSGYKNVDSVEIDIVNETGRLASISCSGDSCDSSGSIINDVYIISSGSEYIVKANVSIPWNVAGELLVRASATDSKIDATVSKVLSLLVVNETSIDWYEVHPREVVPGDRVHVNAMVLYSNTGIPVIGEKVELYFTPSGGAPASTSTDSSGYINIDLRAPEQPGNYDLVIKPLHGKPVRILLVVSEDALGGVAHLLVGNLLILYMIIGISMSALLIILQRKRNYRIKR